MLRDALFLASHYLRSSPGRSLVLVLGSTAAAFLPLFTLLAADLVEDTLLRRAQASPVLIGAKGNEFDLSMSSLYFRGQVAETVPVRELDRLGTRNGTLAIPLYVAHSVGGTPLVGTSVEYFSARSLRPARGRLPALLGEVVAGAEVAHRLRLEVGEHVRSDLANLYNLAGGYPVLLEVVGILERSSTPDDDAYFADVKTTWVLDGLFHGHQAVTREQTLNPDDGEGENMEATAALFLFADLDESNRSSYHMHGSTGDAPLSSILVLPETQKDHDILLGDYALEQNLQAIEPETVVRTVLGIVLRARDALSAFFVVVALSTLCFFVLVISLTLRLRRREIDLMQRIGSGRFAIATIVGTEIVLVLLASALLSTGLTWAGLALIRSQLA